MNDQERYCIKNLVRAATAVMNGESDPRTILCLANNIQHARALIGELKVEYPEFCRSPDKCAGTGRCQSDPVCID